MTNNFYKILSIIENLKIPMPDSTKKNAIKEIGILDSKFVGSSYDEILRKKIGSLNLEKKFIIADNSIFRFIEPDNRKEYELTFDNIYKDLIRKYRTTPSLVNSSGLEIMSNTAEYLTKLAQKIDFNQFTPKDILIIDGKLGYPSNLIDNYGRRRSGTSFKPDLIIDDLILEIKTFDEIKFNNNMLIQLFLYYVRFNHVFNKKNSFVVKGAKMIKYEKKFQIKRLGIYFSKHNYFWTFNISDLCPKKELDILIEFCTSNMKKNNLDFPSEIESLFNLMRSKKFLSKAKTNKDDSLNLLLKNKLNQIIECISIRKSCKDSQILEIISEMIITLNNEYCYPYNNFRYRLDNQFDCGLAELEYDKQLVSYSKIENLSFYEKKYITDSFEDFLFFLNHINKLHKRISLLENLKYLKISKLVKFELDIIEQYLNEKLHSKSQKRQN